MSQDYNYDDQGQFFPYFVTTITALITVPVTYSWLKPSKGLENTAPRIQSDFKPEHADLIEGQRRKQKRKERKVKRMLISIGGWLVIAWMVYLMVVTARTTPKLWDPYSVLEVSMSATEQEIKRRYRMLSLTMHPDKVQPDPEKNLTLEAINDRWVEVTKAFKALTDEEVRNNYLKYGHPDGKQSFSIGIALPKFIVSEGNGKYVLLLYGTLLGVLLPYLVGKWWYGTQRYTREKVLVASAGNLFREYKDDVSVAGLIGMFSSGEEYKLLLKGSKGTAGVDKLEQRILEEPGLSNVGASLSAKDRQKFQEMDDLVRKKALGLLWAYLGRVELDDAALNDEKFEVAPIASALNESFTAIALAYMNTRAILSAYRASQHLIQALAHGAPPLMQLPYFTPAVVKAAEGLERHHLTIQDFMNIPADRRKKLVTAPGLLKDSEYETAMSVVSQLPTLKVDKAFFKVVGERFVTPGSLVNFVVKGRIIPPGTMNVPQVNEKDLEDVDPAEGDLDALHGRKKGEGTDSENPVQPPLAHAPYFARDYSPRWHLFHADSKSGKLAVPPFTFRQFAKPIFDENGKPTFNVQTMRTQFVAPAQPGRYTFVMHLVCDSYIGMDMKMDVVLVVEDPSKAEVMKDEEDISEPEEVWQVR
ncbi:Sec63 Brl domain-containing protein [Lineolata rhizophorae]|uniref:Sec63 Brl domain-containing protein n=1 Tax=Lineolata rhizophorae TaxID=578093 RepID=A0A6A6PD51_9PEZI|nr:Sec63 Brl domain-containing protein [Lineolata rhizophorae]